jgi:hypothetical protein
MILGVLGTEMVGCWSASSPSGDRDGVGVALDREVARRSGRHRPGAPIPSDRHHDEVRVSPAQIVDVDVETVLHQQVGAGEQVVEAAGDRALAGVQVAEQRPVLARRQPAESGGVAAERVAPGQAPP